MVVPTVNSAATLGNAIVNDPGDTASTILGGLAIAGGSTLEGLGGGLDATGVGAPVGLALNTAGAPLIAAGIGSTAKGTIGLANHGSEHQIQILEARSQAAREQDPGYGARPEPPNPDSVPADANPYDPNIADRVPAYGENGDKTSGSLELNGRVRDLVSTEDGPGADPANGGAGTGRDRYLKSHVESHAGAMLKPGDNGTLYINRLPCTSPGKPGCEQRLPRFVPQGARLTVYGPNGYVRVVVGEGPPR